MRQLKFSLLALASLLVACASGSSGSSTQAGAPSPSRTRSNPNVITTDELSRIDVSDALQAIQRLRPQFLQTRGATSFQSPSELVVYVDGSRLGNASTLRDVPANEVKEIRYLSSTEATQRYGTGHTSGAIVVTRK